MIKKNNIEAIHDGVNHHTIHDARSSWAEGAHDTAYDEVHEEVQMMI